MKAFDYVHVVYLVDVIFGHSDTLGKTLQSPTLFAVQGQDCVNMTVKVLEKLRNEKKFNLIWDHVTAKAKSGAPKKLRHFHGSGPAKPAHPDKPKDLYRKHHYKVFDQVINCIKERFSQ